MTVSAAVKAKINAARVRRTVWVRLLDALRLLPSAEGRARLWTKWAHNASVHQTSPDTSENRYPELFDLAVRLKPGAGRIMSFGCSTGEELSALRARFPRAEIVGAEINPRSRRIAQRRTAGDQMVSVLDPADVEGFFDAIFALAVLQREPHKIDAMGVHDLSPYYPFKRFDVAVSDLTDRLSRGGLLCVDFSQYRVEDSTSAKLLDPISKSPANRGAAFGPDGLRLQSPAAKTIFRKR
jgi:hypothetical protein